MTDRNSKGTVAVQSIKGRLRLCWSYQGRRYFGSTTKFREWLGKHLASVTLRERITLLNACWDWAIKRKWLSQNPWSEIKVRVPRRQKPDPFTEAEIKLIVAEVRANSVYSHYSEFFSAALDL